MNIQKKFLKKYTSLQKRITLKKSNLTPALTLFLFIFVLFVTTKGLTPHTSELNYIEHSVSKKGSVVPASCDTATPHDGEICGAWIATGACPSWYACGQAASSIPYSCLRSKYLSWLLRCTTTKYLLSSNPSMFPYGNAFFFWNTSFTTCLCFGFSIKRLYYLRHHT